MNGGYSGQVALLWACSNLRDFVPTPSFARLLRQTVPYHPAASHAPHTSSALFPSWHLLLPGFIFLFIRLVPSCLSTPPSIKSPYRYMWLPRVLSGKESACQCRRHKRLKAQVFDPWVGKSPWRRTWQPTPVFWPAGFQGLYSLWGCKESARPSDFHFEKTGVNTLSLLCY